MTYHQNISRYISRLSFSLLLLFACQGIQAQKNVVIEKDSIPLFRGFQLSFDLVGPAMLLIDDHGHYEGAFRLNLHDQWFPIVEAGYGKADTFDEVTEIHYKTAAPYFRVGIDFNLLRKKHTGNRLFAGLRYAYTSYKVDLERRDLQDPNWHWESSIRIEDAPCSQHWVEGVFGVDAKIAGPLHLGWNVRYKRRIAHKEEVIGKAWYVPGFGVANDDRIEANFNVIIDI